MIRLIFYEIVDYYELFKNNIIIHFIMKKIIFMKIFHTSTYSFKKQLFIDIENNL